jgi:hypothetical protein
VLVFLFLSVFSIDVTQDGLTSQDLITLTVAVIDPHALPERDEARSQRIAEKQEYILGEERPAPVPFWKRMWIN